MLGNWIREDCPDPGDEQASGNACKSVWSKLVNWVVWLTVGLRDLETDLADLKLVTDDQCRRDNTDDANDRVLGHLQDDVVSKRSKEPEEDKNAGYMLVWNIINEKGDAHGHNGTEDAQDKAEKARARGRYHADVDHDHGPDETLSDEKRLGRPEIGDNRNRHGGARDAEAEGGL